MRDNSLAGLILDELTQLYGRTLQAKTVEAVDRYCEKAAVLYEILEAWRKADTTDETRDFIVRLASQTFNRIAEWAQWLHEQGELVRH